MTTIFLNKKGKKRLTGSVGQTQAAITRECSYNEASHMRKEVQIPRNYGDREAHIIQWRYEGPNKEATNQPHEQHDGQQQHEHCEPFFLHVMPRIMDQIRDNREEK